MKILSIETSCDETALSIMEAEGGLDRPRFRILASNIASQIEIHKKYGGVYPMMAKREHSRNLVPLLKKTLKESKLKIYNFQFLISKEKDVKNILEREPELQKQLLIFLKSEGKPNIDAIAVTYGPGLEPALWVGINFAKALSLMWDIPLIPVNHMEGHVVSALLSEQKLIFKFLRPKFQKIRKVEFPALALLISGGHTELVLIKNWMDYEILGETLDDAVGEAFDKVARMLGLPYPGGPEISRLVEKYNIRDTEYRIRLPRPMIHSGDYNFSFSGLKTSVLYLLKKIPEDELTQDLKSEIAREFQDAVTEVLVKKTMRAVEEHNIKTLLIGGGVIANRQIRAAFKASIGSVPTLALYFPRKELTTDNSIMIAMAGYFRILGAEKGSIKFPDPHPLRACGGLRLG